MHFKENPVTLFEVSWEVCNKVGGIYSVVTSKTLQTKDNFDENYFLLGPDLQNNADFEETDEKIWDPIRMALAAKNFKCRFGRWNIPGRPKAILVSFNQRYESNQLLYDFWKNYGVDSLSGGWDYIEPVMFATVCGAVISAIHEAIVETRQGRSVALFHEWMCGAGLLALKKISPSIATVFTTHATMLGRSMAGTGRDIYTNLEGVNPAGEAAALNVTAKWSMESTCAREADIFTTVSSITGEEAIKLLGRTPDVITTNGLDMRIIPDHSQDRTTADSQRLKIIAAANRFLRCELPTNTRIFTISGRYEVHNKGVDVFLESLAQMEKSLAGTDATVLALCLVMGGHTGVNEQAISGDINASDDGLPFVCTHYAWNAPQDPIITTCRRLGLNNKPENRVKVIFVPAMLNGNDGFFNMPYEDILVGSDCGVFPSWYEPWGYTPQESAAWSVPTVTTDLSGFGIWAKKIFQDVPTSADEGMVVLPRRGKDFAHTASALHDALIKIATAPDGQLMKWRASARKLAEQSDWAKFFENYKEAFNLALTKADARITRGGDTKESLNRVVQAFSAATPYLRTMLAVAELPTDLQRLRDISRNLWWCWSDKAKSLFMALNPPVWEKCHNPIQMLEESNPERLQDLLNNTEYMQLYHDVVREFDEYMAQPQRSLSEHVDADHPIAYFSTEYGLNESVPIYSGGLGVLSGDHLKSSSDLALPLIGIGLLYKQGYFHQEIDANGRQVAHYIANNIGHLPVTQLYDSNGEPIIIQLELPGRLLFAKVWKMQVGRTTLYLMDTDTNRNTVEDRAITNQLYVGNRETRLLQEMLLGIGGMRLIRTLGLNTHVYHMNEGHSAFLVLERMRECITLGMSYSEAMARVRSNTIFTTHTPVAAGNEAFSVELMHRYFTGFANALGLSWNNFVQLGQIEGGNAGHFEMTVLALRFCSWANGVSRLHGEVSRHMWNRIWRSLPLAETPITYVTNGIHTPSYVGTQMHELLDQYLGQGWLSASPDSEIWNKVDEIPDDTYWAARLTQKEELLNALRASIPTFAQKFGLSSKQSKEMERLLKPSTLIIGFARRFAPYKRATLLFADLDRLAKIMDDSQRPVCFVFAGKAHPADEPGIDLIQEVMRIARDPRFLGKIFFMENYNLGISRLLSQGCDVWLNTPRRPYEASGTSGMKLPVNGGINLSISDGWWCEGYNRKNGWTIGPVVKLELPTDTQNDYADAESLYHLLESDVIPLFFDHDAQDLPRNWISVSKQSLKSLTAMYSSNRMLEDYVEHGYLPAAARRDTLAAHHWKLAKDVAAWMQDLPARFGSLKMEDITITGADGTTMTCGEPVHFRLHMHLGQMQANEVQVQLVIGLAYANGNFRNAPQVINLEAQSADHGDDGMDYVTTFTPTRNGRYRYGLRVLPMHKGLSTPLDTGLMYWG